MITFKHGDVTTAESGVIAHVVNNIGLFGAGVAKAIADKWPEVKRDYLHWKGMNNRFHPFSLGHIKLSKVSNLSQDITVAHLLAMNGVKAQWNPNPLDMEALKDCLESVMDVCDSCGFDLHMPKIGSGLAGGNWDEIFEIIKGLDEIYNVNITVWEL